MSMHTLTSAGVIAALGGCGLATEAPDQTAVAQAASTGLPLDDGDRRVYFMVPRCPESSTNCTGTNGPGIYAEEGGRAGIDVNNNSENFALMITNFINTGSSVKFRARYLDTSPLLSYPPWQWVTGTVDSADYLPEPGFSVVVSVDERATFATWRLVDPTTHAMRAVTDTDLGNLQLHIGFIGNGGLIKLILNFTDATFASGPGTRNEMVQSYKMRWRIEGDRAPSPDPDGMPRPYCLDARGYGDRVVFQRTISVDPINGKVEHDGLPAVHVTMSCALGAIATAYRWGYQYVASAADPFYFEAAIPMKRASYCADENAYTIAGTNISIVDSLAIQHDEIDDLEAWWSPGGAICVNSMRHPELCGDSCVSCRAAKPPCPLDLPAPSPLAHRYFMNGVVHLPE